jgi:hypothetical protein
MVNTPLSQAAQSSQNVFWSRIHEHTISMRFLGIILRVLRLERFQYTIFTLQTSFKLQGGKAYFCPNYVQEIDFCTATHISKKLIINVICSHFYKLDNYQRNDFDTNFTSLLSVEKPTNKAHWPLPYCIIFALMVCWGLLCGPLVQWIVFLLKTKPHGKHRGRACMKILLLSYWRCLKVTSIVVNLGNVLCIFG